MATQRMKQVTVFLSLAAWGGISLRGAQCVCVCVGGVLGVAVRCALHMRRAAASLGLAAWDGVSLQGDEGRWGWLG